MRGNTYGRSDSGNLAVARGGGRRHGVWDVCEVDGDRYHIVSYDSLSEAEMDRADELEAGIEPRPGPFLLPR